MNARTIFIIGNTFTATIFIYFNFFNLLREEEETLSRNTKYVFAQVYERQQYFNYCQLTHLLLFLFMY